VTINQSQEDVADSPQELRHRVPADADQLTATRDTLSAWADRIGMTREQREDLVLAAYEAMANSAEHAYPDRGDGMIDLHAHRGPDAVTVVVTDHGTWRPPQPDNTLRGRGLLLIKALAHRSEVTHDDTGTTVTMTWPLPDTH
jgi:serine/threonine-protein kinase RsbW